jgi:DNA (cytosine-5)-methyltransferase 1
MNLDKPNEKKLPLRVGSVCSGIGGFDLAFIQSGFEVVWACEIDRQAREMLRFQWPDLIIYADIKKLRSIEGIEGIDVLCGGTPCQSFSIAGLRKGLADPRGNLALIFLGLVERFRPRWVVWENVPGVHSSWSDVETHPAGEEAGKIIAKIKGLGKELGVDAIANFGPGDFEEVDQANDFDCFVAGLEKLGYGVATTVLDAQYFGLAQRRKRVFVVGCAGGRWEGAAAVLFDRPCMRGDFASVGEEGDRAAGDIANSPDSGGERAE